MAKDQLYENIKHWLPKPKDCAGAFGIPVISSTELPAVDQWMPFNYLPGSGADDHEGVSMYVDDYQINRLWNQPTRYVDMLSKAGLVLTPDYSLYTDVPVTLNLYNHYRKHWLGAYWQRHGVKVVPTICWSDENSFDYCFDGEPVSAVVSVSSVGTQRRADTKAAFLRGYDAMLERLQPQTVLFFGNIPRECRGNICPVEAFYKTVERRAASAKA